HPSGELLHLLDVVSTELVLDSYLFVVAGVIHDTDSDASRHGFDIVRYWQHKRDVRKDDITRGIDSHVPHRVLGNLVAERPVMSQAHCPGDKPPRHTTVSYVRTDADEANLRT